MKNAFTYSERKAIGEWVRSKRHNRSMTQKDLANELGCTRVLVSDIERGTYLTKIEFLACCRVFHSEDSNKLLQTIRCQINDFDVGCKCN